MHLASAIEESREETRSHSRELAAAGLLLLLGSSPMLPRISASSDTGRSRIVARTLASYWAMRMMTSTRESVAPNAPFKAAVSIDASIVRTSVTENVHAFNVERLELARDAANEVWAPHFVEQWEAVLDGRVCAECAAMDGQRTELGAMFSNGERPPIHPHCRCFVEVVRRHEVIAA